MWNDKVKYNISFENIFQLYKDVVKIFILNLALFSLLPQSHNNIFDSVIYPI